VPPTARTAALAALNRLRSRWFNLVQTAVAAGLAWYIAHDLLAHPQPFFAPIAAAVCLSITNVLRALRAVQMMVGVTLGIGIGVLVEELMGTGTVPIAVAALLALSVAVLIGQGFIGQGMMFANQTVVSSILVLALFRSGIGWERIFDALIGGSLAIVFAILLFPADPLEVLGRARVGVLAVLQRGLNRAADVAAGRLMPAPDWPFSVVDQVHEQLGGLIAARATAHQVVQVSPRRWRLRAAVRTADHQAVHLALLAGTILQVTRAVAPPGDGSREPVEAALVALAAATASADSDPAGASAYLAAAGAREKSQVVLANVVGACVDDLQRVIDLRQL